jgi:crotonobetainyl-CoA:carnitine CoA-transferase CaiB-like acyl-CoA transferase
MGENVPNPAVQPLAGLRVVEFTHMVMGPTCGMILGDLGAEVIKVEPIEGEGTRRLLGAGAGFFPMFNRNKKSLAADLHHPGGVAGSTPSRRHRRRRRRELQARHDGEVRARVRVAVAGESATRLREQQGIPAGPLRPSHRARRGRADDGRACLHDGRPGDPLRAGTSVNDIMGGMFGAIATLGALIQRGVTGRGMEVQSALYENNVFLMGQHMLQFAVTGRHPAPMPARDNPWAIYDVFTVAGGEQIFLAAVSDAQWIVFCDVLGLGDLKSDPAYATNNQRVVLRPQLLAQLRARLADRSAAELAETMERAGLPFAPIRRPEDLYDDPHLKATGGLADVRLPDGAESGRDRQDDAASLHDGRRASWRAYRSAEARRTHARALD